MMEEVVRRGAPVCVSGLKSARRLGRLFCGCTHGRAHVPGLKPWVIIGRDRSALWAVLESGLKSTRRLCRLYDGGSGQARSACLCKRTEVRKATWSPFLLLHTRAYARPRVETLGYDWEG